MIFLMVLLTFTLHCWKKNASTVSFSLLYTANSITSGNPSNISNSSHIVGSDVLVISSLHSFNPRLKLCSMKSCLRLPSHDVYGIFTMQNWNVTSCLLVGWDTGSLWDSTAWLEPILNHEFLSLNIVQWCGPDGSPVLRQRLCSLELVLWTASYGRCDFNSRWRSDLGKQTQRSCLDELSHHTSCFFFACWVQTEC